jgi:integrase
MADLPPHTVRHGNKFKVRLIVPRKLRAAIGKSIIFETLHTDSLKQARRLQPAALARLRAIIDGKPLPPMPDGFAKAMDIAELVGRMDVNRSSLAREKALRLPGYALVEAGQATPLAAFVDQWIEQSGFAPRTAQKRRQAVAELIRWLGNRPPLFETIDRKLAYEFRDKELAKRHPETANSLLSGLRSFWDWAIDRQKAEAVNHWRAMKSMPKKARPKSDRQRGFREEELTALFYSPAKLTPLMALAAFSGARLGELCALRVRDVVYGKALRDKCADLDIRYADCPNGAFFFRYDEQHGKTASAERLTPIHSAVAGLVRRMIKGKRPDDLLFPDDRRKRQGSTERPYSFSLTQQFERYRKACGVDDREDGRNRSRVTFHSFRHTFVSAAMRALADGVQGFNAYTLADVVGHSKAGMALAMTAEGYAESAALGARMACVESVKLPLAAAIMPLGQIQQILDY